MIAQAKQRVAAGFLVLAALSLVSGCAGSPTTNGPVEARAAKPGASRPAGIATRAAAVALDQVGTPYRYGGQSPASGFDCSGLVHYAYLSAGRALPRTTSRLWSHTKRVSRGNLRAGDLVFFSIEGKMQHVGLYIGDDRFVHAPSTGRTVSVESLSTPFYRAALLGGGRPP